MNIKKLHFFDKSGYELNFDWNKDRNCWEGNIYLPKVSVGLYANTSIYVLEEIENNKFVFPQYENNGRKDIIFSWDILNKFVDEFFMFTFDSSYIQSDTSALTYVENDGPDCEPVLITRFDEYKIDLDTNKEERALPIHVAFISLEKYDSNTFKRTLVMSYNFKPIARINFFAETIEEDERLKSLNYNFGYNISNEDTIIFKNSNIKEPYPDFSLLNEKRKELMIEGHNIYPYIGSYKALINAIKFFGYDNLNIIEFWKNVNNEDSNFGKIYHVKKYELSNKEHIIVNDNKINVPNQNYKKLSNIALSYKINIPVKRLKENTDNEYENDYHALFELPYTEEIYNYTIEEAVIKLFALRDKLNKEFLAGKNRVIDVIGESNYFGLCSINQNSQFGFTSLYKSGENLSIEVFPDNIIRIDKNKILKDYIFKTHINNWNKSSNINKDTILGNISQKNISRINLSKSEDVNNYVKTEKERCDIYKDFYTKLYYDKTINDNTDNDFHDYFNDKFTKDNETISINSYIFDKNNYEYLHNTISAKVVLSNTLFTKKTFGNVSGSFGNINKFITFNNIDNFGYNHIKWTIRHSKNNNQIDDELKNIGVEKKYKYYNWSCTKEGSISEYNSVFFELPFIGYYDVELSITDSFNNISSMVFTKYIKVEPYNLDIRGFYYDAREIPENILGLTKYKNLFGYKTYIDNLYNNIYSEEFNNLPDEYYDEMKKYILGRLEYMTYIATSESSITGINEMSMPIYKSNFLTTNVDGVDYKRFYIDNDTYRIYKQYDFLKSSFLYSEYKEGDKYPIKNKKDILTDEIIGKPKIDDNNPNPIETTNTGPYTFDFFKNEWKNSDNVNINITKLTPNIQNARYIKNGVDVKPYTWILLGYNNSKISGKIIPKYSDTYIIKNKRGVFQNIWTITNTTTGKKYTHNGKFITLLLTEEGNYTVSLKIKDINGNIYEASRNLIIVSKDANYKLYTPFITDFYDIYNSSSYNDSNEDSDNDYYDSDYTDSDYIDNEIKEIGYVLENNIININTDDLTKGEYTLYYADEFGNEIEDWSPITKFSI